MQQDHPISNPVWVKLTLKWPQRCISVISNTCSSPKKMISVLMKSNQMCAKHRFCSNPAKQQQSAFKANLESALQKILAIFLLSSTSLKCLLRALDAQKQQQA